MSSAAKDLGFRDSSTNLFPLILNTNVKHSHCDNGSMFGVFHMGGV